ncbi:DUF4338 domain-containing protein [Alphaproteobacteria bacterium]|nr:DUF4338 domain-containing protein [Alphaproteobacteria bacterium]
MQTQTFIPYDMDIDNADQKWSAFSQMLTAVQASFSKLEHNKISESLRGFAEPTGKVATVQCTDKPQKLDPVVKAFTFVLADLIDQKWVVKASKTGLYLARGEKTEDLVRSQLHARRDASLSEPSTQKFLNHMENPSAGSTRKSIKHLIHDGANLAKQLQTVRNGTKKLTDVINPILQLVSADEKDKATNNYLTDIWRYCRLTWSLEHQSIPGRQMAFLIRNAAQPNNPIMAIGSLASPVLQHKLRDDWVGWTYDSVLAAYATGKLKYRDVVETASTALDEAVEKLYIADLELSENSLKQPSFRDIYHLETIADREKINRVEVLKSKTESDYRKKVIPSEMDIDGILDRTKSPLFRSKRAGQLAKILKAKRFINKLDKSKNQYEATQMLFATTEGKSALGFAIGEIRTVGAASRIADLNVCGAIPPYNHLIGGKLAALSVFSDEMQKFYRLRYKNAESEIATFMAGKPITRPTNLEVITTTSLFGAKLGQYHGLHLKKNRHPSLVSDCHWERLGLTSGEGTFHFSNKTNSVLQEYLRDARGYRQVNNVFGEGTSPKMRNLRTALQSLGFNADDLMSHQQQRLFLAAELNPNAKERLKNSHLKNATKRSKFRDISNAWIDQWVKNRINKDGLLETISSENFERLASSLRPASYDEQFKLL